MRPRERAHLGRRWSLVTARLRMERTGLGPSAVCKASRRTQSFTQRSRTTVVLEKVLARSTPHAPALCA